MVENWDGPPTGYDWKQFLASVKLVRLTKLDSRPWPNTETVAWQESYEQDKAVGICGWVLHWTYSQVDHKHIILHL